VSRPGEFLVFSANSIATESVVAGFGVRFLGFSHFIIILGCAVLGVDSSGFKSLKGLFEGFNFREEEFEQYAEAPGSRI
jgi:hypothetical protein